MRYEPTTLDKASKLHDKVIEGIQHAKTGEWGPWVDGIPVFQQVKDLADRLRASCPDFKFVGGDYSWTRSPLFQQSIPVYNVLYVFLDDCPFNVGVIGYGDFRVRRQGDTKNQYMVFSRLVENAKFGHYRDQHHMKMSDSLDKTVKDCLRYLTPYTTQEIAKVYFEPMRSTVIDRTRKLKDEEWSLLRPIANNASTLMKELRRLMDAGVQFKDPAFIDFANKIEDLEQRIKEENDRNTGAKFVRLRTVGDTQFADVAEVVDIKKTNHGEIKFASPPTTIPADELSEDVVGKIAVLSILNEGQYANDVGYKANENTFFIETA